MKQLRKRPLDLIAGALAVLAGLVIGAKNYERDWPDLVRGSTEVITTDPKTSGKLLAAVSLTLAVQGVTRFFRK